MLLEDHQLALVEWTDVVRGIRVGTGGGCHVLGLADDGGVRRIRLAVAAGGQLILQAPLGDAAGYWFPAAGEHRGLPADWLGVDRFSAIRSAPVGVLYEADGTSPFAFGVGWTVGEGELQFGVSEEDKNFVVRLPIDERLAGRTTELEVVVAAHPAGYATALGVVADALYAGTPARPASSAALEPVYSTWYAYSQRISDEIVSRDLPIAAELGFGSVFLDDGWQRFGDGRWYAGCGDWVPDAAKFPDLAGFVARAQAQGLEAVLWLAPLLVGEQSDVYERLAPFATAYSEGLRAWVLDPRHREVREHVVGTCARLMRDYGLDGLKVDFLNNASIYAGTPSSGDLDDVGFAMVELLRDVADAVDVVRPGALIEFRQPYVSPSVAAYADVVRADDCPADADRNRRSVLDLRLFARGQIVHADPIMWAPEVGPEQVARQLLAGYFGVPQVSMPLSTLPDEHLRAIADGLAQWRALRELLLDGRITAGVPHRGYPVVQSRRDDVLLVVDYESGLAELDLAGVRELVLLNATHIPGIAYRVTVGASPALGTAGVLEVPALGLTRIDLRTATA